MSSFVPDYRSVAKDFWLKELESTSYGNDWPDGRAPDAIEHTLSCFIEGLEQIIGEGSEYLESGWDSESTSWNIPPESALEIANTIKSNVKFLTACAYSRTYDLRNIRKEIAANIAGNPDEDPDTLIDQAFEECFHKRDVINRAYEYVGYDTLDNRKASFGTLVLMHEILEREGLSSPERWLTEKRDKVELLGREKLLKWSKLHIPPTSASYLDRAIDCYFKDIGLDVIAIMCRAALDAAIEDTISQEALIKRYGSAAENPRRHIYFGLRYIKDTGVLDKERVDTLYRIRRIGTDVVHNIPSVEPHIETAESKLEESLAKPIVISPEEIEKVHARLVEKNGEDAKTPEQVESLLKAIEPLSHILLYQFIKSREGFDKLIGPTFSLVDLIASGAGYNRDSN